MPTGSIDPAQMTSDSRTDSLFSNRSFRKRVKPPARSANMLKDIHPPVIIIDKWPKFTNTWKKDEDMFTGLINLIDTFYRKKKPLAEVDFPLETLRMLSDRHILVGGGGGPNNPRIPNGFAIFELSHDGVNFIAKEITRYDTGDSKIRNCDLYDNGKDIWIVAGEKSYCQLYNINCYIDILEDGEKLKLALQPTNWVQTVFGDNVALQRVVKVSLDGKIMATGGTDGKVRLWNFPQLDKLYDLDAHREEIVDLDFSPDGSLLVTISRYGEAFLWSVKNGRKIKKFVWVVWKNAKYIYRRCRFRRATEHKTSIDFFMTSNIVTSNSPNHFNYQGGFLQLWNANSGIVLKSVVYEELLSTLAVTDDGRYVAVGTSSGIVDIFLASNLKKMLHITWAHSTFVTGLEFLSTNLNGLTTTNGTLQTAVVSISLDNRIYIHNFRKQLRCPPKFWFAVIQIMLIIYDIFLLYDRYDT